MNRQGRGKVGLGGRQAGEGDFEPVKGFRATLVINIYCLVK